MAELKLPQEHCDMCRKAVQMADESEEFMQQCLDCGLDVQQYIDQIRAAKAQNQNMLRVFHADKQ
jgi:Zn ribbon nucleic-acid-binding protein